MWFLSRHFSCGRCCPEEGADPESIEKVALQVLSITLPFNRTTLDKMIMQIKDSLSNLTNIEGIINQTLQHTGKAKELLDQAKDAKYVKLTPHLPLWEGEHLCLKSQDTPLMCFGFPPLVFQSCPLHCSSFRLHPSMWEESTHQNLTRLTSHIDWLIKRTKNSFVFVTYCWYVRLCHFEACMYVHVVNMHQ